MSLSYQYKTLREDSVLTTIPEFTQVRWKDDNLNLSWENQVVLYVKFVKWSLDSMIMKVYFSPDNIDYFQECSIDINSGVGTVNKFDYSFTSNGNYRIPIPIKDKYMKISVEWSGNVSGSSCKIINITWTA